MHSAEALAFRGNHVKGRRASARTPSRVVDDLVMLTAPRERDVDVNEPLQPRDHRADRQLP